MTPQIAAITVALAICLLVLGALLGDLVNQPRKIRRIFGVACIFILGIAVGQPISNFLTGAESLNGLVSKHQTLIAALVALAAAVIAYNGQMAKVQSDENARRKDAEARATGVVSQLGAITMHLHHRSQQVIKILQSSRDRKTALRMAIQVMRPGIERAQLACDRAWITLDAIPNAEHAHIAAEINAVQHVVENLNIQANEWDRLIADTDTGSIETVWPTVIKSIEATWKSLTDGNYAMGLALQR